MKKSTFLFSLALLPIVALANEPSAFGATESSNSISTYNITTTEKKTPSSSQRFSNSNDSATPSRAERIDTSATSEQYEGMRSVVDSYASKIAKMDERMRHLEEENKKLREYVEESRKIQNDNQEKIKTVVGELGSLIDSINKNYVPKDKFEQLSNELRGGKTSSKQTATVDTSKNDDSKDKSSVASTTKEKIPSQKELSLKDSATLMKDADDLYEKKSYNEAKAMYTELLNRNYKPAKINYNLGEIAYNQKAYSGAIEYYKASIALFDKAPYTPTLLYHTGSSFEKMNKLKEAQGFYKALKDGYPNSPEAKKIK